MDASDSIDLYRSRKTEIVFLDLETTVPRRAGQGFSVLEFGAIVFCPRKLVELESYTTLIRPKDLSMVALRSGRRDGITRDAVANAPTFEEVADKIFDILNGRVWGGHNIQRFDCIRIREAFAATGRAPPIPARVIDSLGVLTEKFGRRAGNMKACISSSLNPSVFLLISWLLQVWSEFMFSFSRPDPADGNTGYLFWSGTAKAQVQESK